jgi:hypothetical protein
MPVATAYTESALASFMASAIGPVADVLGWSTSANSYNLPISREAWRLVVQHLATRYDISLDQQSLKRSQLQAMAKEALILAEADVWVALAAPDVTLLASGRAAVTIHSLTYPGDPYGPRLDALGLTAEVGA